MLVPGQIKAARALLGIRQSDLAQRAGVAEITVKALEQGTVDPRVSTINKIQSALEAAGIEFISGGVRLKTTHDRLHHPVPGASVHGQGHSEPEF